MPQPRGWYNAHLGVLSALLKSTVRRAPGRPFTATAAQGKKIAEAASRKNTLWTIEHDRKLVELRAAGTRSKDLKKHFPDRSLSSILSRYRRIGLGVSQDSTLVGKINSPVVSQRVENDLAHDAARGALLPQHGDLTERAEQPGISEERATRAPGSKAKEQYVRGRYTDAENAQLSSLVEAGFTWPAIQARMPKRSPKSLYSHWYQSSSDRPSRLWASNASTSARKDGWSEAEITQLNRLHALGKRSDYIAKALGRSLSATQWRIWILSKQEGKGNVSRSAPNSIDSQTGSLRDHDTSTHKP